MFLKTDKPDRVMVINNLAIPIASTKPETGYWGQYNWFRPQGTRPLSNFPGGISGSGGDPKNR